MIDENLLGELRAKHGDVEQVDFMTDDGNTVTVVLRKPVADMADPKRDEYLRYLTRRFALEQGRGIVPDPADDGTDEIVACAVYPDTMKLRAHLADYPADAIELGQRLDALAGMGRIEEDKALVTDEVREKFHRRAWGFRVSGEPLVVRPLSRNEYATFVSKNGGRPYPFRGEALAWAARACARELPKAGAAPGEAVKPEFEALLARVPYLAAQVGAHLVNRTLSRVADREKK